MICLPSLWLPILLSAVFVFILSSLIHMVFKWHNSDYRALPGEEEVRAALLKANPAPGQYVLPHCLDPKDMEKEEVRQKFLEGPVGLIYLQAKGLPRIGGSLVLWFIFNVVLGVFVAYLLSRTLSAGTPYLQVFRVAGTVTFLAHAAGAVPNAIFMGKPWRVVLKEGLDALLYALLVGGTFGWLWPK